MTEGGVAVREAAAGWPDDVRRATDHYNLHLAAIGFSAYGRWIAIRLSDGGSDGVLYDSKEDAIGHQLHEQLCAYMVILPSGVTERQMSNYLKFTRQLYDGGMRLLNNHDGTSPTVQVPYDYQGGRL